MLVQAVFFLILVQVGLRFIPLPALQCWIGAWSRGVARFRRICPSQEQICWAVEAAGRHVPGAQRCLPQALVTEGWLKSHGFSAQLKIGVTLAKESRLMAHAWVESSDQVVIGGSLAPGRYTPMVNFKAMEWS